MLPHQGYPGQNAEQAPPSKVVNTLPKKTEPVKKKVPGKKYPWQHLSLKKFLTLGLGLGVAAAGIYVGNHIVAAKAKHDHITQLLTSKSWQALQPLSSIYIHNVLYKDNNALQKKFKDIITLLTKSYTPDYYFPFAFTASIKPIDHRSLLLLSKEEIAQVQSFSDKLSKDDVDFMKDQEKKEAQWKRFLTYKNRSWPLYENFMWKAKEVLSLHTHSDLESLRSKEKRAELLEIKFNESKEKAAANAEEIAQATEAYKILKIYFIDNGNRANINPANFPIIWGKLIDEQRVTPPDEEGNY